MSYDASSLRGYLQRIDVSAPAIQGAAGAMMKHYDKSPGVAVVEWRNALMQARENQFLPLLYVANEVLQNSKRNRGNKFLEAFSPILGQSLIFVCAKSPPPLVESIRRTVKIWAERRVFSVRYVNELIKGLEPYRNRNGGGGKKSRHIEKSSSSTSDRDRGNSSPGGSRFSPVTVPQISEQSTMQNKDAFGADMSMNNDADNDNGDDMFGDINNNQDDGDDYDDDDDSDDDDDLFGNASKKLLKIDVDFDRASSATNSNGKKRRRSSIESTNADNANDPANKAKAKGKSKRRASSQYLSTNSLMELMNQVSTLQASYDRVSGKLQEINKLDNGDDEDNKRIETLVGDELLAEYKKVLGYEQQIDRQRRELHSIAQKRRGLELEALRYLPWLERALKQDQDDVDFSLKFRKQLELFRGVYQPTRQARDQRLREEERRLDAEEELRKKRQDEEERKKFMKSAMSKQTEAQPGMVWNRATGEYQHLNQEESWRD